MLLFGAASSDHRHPHFAMELVQSRSQHEARRETSRDNGTAGGDTFAGAIIAAAFERYSRYCAVFTAAPCM